MIHDRQEQVDGIAEYQERVVAEQMSDPELMNEALSRHGLKFGAEQVRPPSASDAESILRCGRSKAPGRDGLPHQAWRAVPDAAERFLVVY